MHEGGYYLRYMCQQLCPLHVQKKYKEFYHLLLLEKRVYLVWDTPVALCLTLGSAAVFLFELLLEVVLLDGFCLLAAVVASDG